MLFEPAHTRLAGAWDVNKAQTLAAGRPRLRPTEPGRPHHPPHRARKSWAAPTRGCSRTRRSTSASWCGGIDVAEFLWVYGSLCVAAFAAGAVNAVAGGGTLLDVSDAAVRPTPPDVIANATSTVALVPGSLAGAWGYRRELRGSRRWLSCCRAQPGGRRGRGAAADAHRPRLFHARRPLAAPDRGAALPGAAALARWFPPQPDTGRASLGVQTAVVVFQFFVAVYGGYFGAGIGILMLTSLGFMGMGDIHRINAVKTILAAVINGVSIVVFVMDGKVDWRYAPVMAVAVRPGRLLRRRYRPPHSAGDPARLRRGRRPGPGGVLFPEAGPRSLTEGRRIAAADLV